MSPDHTPPYDLFISYAHVDDVPVFGAKDGWVTTLATNLKNRIVAKLGRRDAFSCWWDRSNLRGHHSVTPEIREALSQSTALLMILSTGYLSSEWCLEEKNLFFEALGGDVRNRVFVVELEPLDRDLPHLGKISDIRKYPFWHRDLSDREYTLTIQDPEPQKQDYIRLVEDLASDISDELKATIREPRATVFLAEATDDLDSRCNQVRRYLANENIRVLPERRYLEGAAFREMLEENLGQCTLFVQLLGKLTGKRPPEFPNGYAYYQWEQALVHKLPVLQWRDPDLSMDAVEPETQRRLLDTVSVHAETLESFKARVVRQAIQGDAPQPLPSRSPAPVVFINYERRDQAIARELGACVPEQLMATFPAGEKTAAKIRKDLEDKLLECDALIVVYGKGTPSWVDKQLLHFNRIAGDRAYDLNALGVCNGPPEDKEEFMTRMPGLEILECRRAIDCQRVQAFLAPLLQ